jgi:hypothetical protein
MYVYWEIKGLTQASGGKKMRPKANIILGSQHIPSPRKYLRV